MFWVKKATAAMTAMVVVFGFGIGVGVTVKQVPMAVAGDGETARGEIPGQPTASANSDDRAKELQALKDELAAVEQLVKSAEAGVELSSQKLKLSKQALEKGTGSLAERLSDEITLTRFEENLAVAQGKRTSIIRRIAELKSLMASATGQQSKPNPAKPLPTAPGDLQKQLNDLRDRLRKNEAYTTQLAADRERLQAEQALLLERIKELSRALERVAPAGAEPKDLKDAIVLQVSNKGVRWIFTVTEHDRDGKPVGTAWLDSTELLRRYLARASKGPSAPHEVRIAADKNIDVDWLKQVLAVVGESGLKVSSVQLSAAGQGGADDNRLVPWVQLVKDREARDAAKRSAELEMLKNELDRLKRLKAQPPINPARP
jgi:hypothetical protein